VNEQEWLELQRAARETRLAGRPPNRDPCRYRPRPDARAHSLCRGITERESVWAHLQNGGNWRPLHLKHRGFLRVKRASFAVRA
jgi:hypothetical protein